jgi:death-on-curing protein
MKAPVWVLREVVLAVHDQLIAAFGGAAGLRDAGVLDSALARPQQHLAYASGDTTIFDLAAAYAFGLAKNHAFVDGNTRIAFTTAIVFLELNGYRVEATEADAAIRTLALAAGEMKKGEYAGWLRANSKKSK